MDEVLARAGLFQGIDPEVAAPIIKELEYVDVSRGEVIFAGGSRATACTSFCPAR